MTNLILPGASEFPHLDHLTPQSTFPKYDVTNENVPHLEYVLLDQDASTFAYETTERASSMFTIAHAVLTQMHRWLPEYSEQKSRWISAGVSQYEVISGLLRINEDNSHLNSFAIPYGLRRRIESNDYNDYFQEAYMDFCRSMPNLEKLIKNVTEKTIDRSPSAVEMALYGAAMQRKNELDALATSETVTQDRRMGVPDELHLPLDLLEDMINDADTQ